MSLSLRLLHASALSLFGLFGVVPMQGNTSFHVMLEASFSPLYETRNRKMSRIDFALVGVILNFV